MAPPNLRNSFGALWHVLPDDVGLDDLARLRHELQRQSFWQNLREKYAGAEAEWAEVQKKWEEAV